jgi:hypothetical protein
MLSTHSPCETWLATFAPVVGYFAFRGQRLTLLVPPTHITRLPSRQTDCVQDGYSGRQ